MIAYIVRRLFQMVIVLIGVTVITFAWTGQFPPPTIYLQVIWVIGLCMIILSLIHRLPRGVLVAIGFQGMGVFKWDAASRT